MALSESRTWSHFQEQLVRLRGPETTKFVTLWRCLFTRSSIDKLKNPRKFVHPELVENSESCAVWITRSQGLNYIFLKSFWYILCSPFQLRSLSRSVSILCKRGPTTRSHRSIGRFWSLSPSSSLQKTRSDFYSKRETYWLVTHWKNSEEMGLQKTEWTFEKKKRLAMWRESFKTNNKLAL